MTPLLFSLAFPQKKFYFGKVSHPLSLEAMQAKTCTRCKEKRPPSGFYAGNSHCKSCVKERTGQWQRDNPELVSEYQRARHKRDRESRNAYSRAYAKADPNRHCAKEARRRAAKTQRFPAWADREAIDAIYASCPPGHHVDHIIPLRGELVSGLHVANNLQHLPADENHAKGNSY